MKTLLKLVLILVCAGAVAVWIAGKSERGELTEDQPVAVKTEKAPSVACTLQPDREKLLATLISANVFSKYDVANSVCHVWIESKFYLLNFEDKQKFVSVAAAWAKCEDPKCDVAVLFDNRSGKEVGRFGAVYGGLKMD